jgi:superfamily I DNA and RNA helicase
MAATKEQLEARLEALKRSRDTGVLVVSHGDTSTTYRSLREMNSIIDDLEAEIAAFDDGKKRYRTIRLHTKDGW